MQCFKKYIISILKFKLKIGTFILLLFIRNGRDFLLKIAFSDKNNFVNYWQIESGL